MIIMKNTILIFLFSISVCSSYANDFDKTCEYFNELSQKPNLKYLSSPERYSFIENKVRNFKEDSLAKSAWYSLSVSPEFRYELFKQGAEEIIGSSWDCPSMKTLSPTVAEGELSK